MRTLAALTLCGLAACGAGAGTGGIAASPGTTPNVPSIGVSPTSGAAAGATPGTPSPPAPRATPPHTPGTGTAPTGSGVRGVVHAGPTCPVERVDSPCPDRTIEASIDVYDRATARRVAHTLSGPDGRFSIALTPGEYTVRASSKEAMSCTPVEVTVRARSYTTVDVACDTGMR